MVTVGKGEEAAGGPVPFSTVEYALAAGDESSSADDTFAKGQTIERSFAAIQSSNNHDHDGCENESHAQGWEPQACGANRMGRQRKLWFKHYGRLRNRIGYLHRRDRGGFDRRKKAVSQAGKSFDIKRIFSRVTERNAEAVNGSIQSAFEIDKNIGGPESRTELFTRDQTSRRFDEGGKDLKWPMLQADAHAMLAQFSRFEVQLEGAESS